MVSPLSSRTLTVAVANCAARDAAAVDTPWREWGRQRRRPVPVAFLCRRAEKNTQKENSPSRWRFCPLDPLTFRFRVRPPG
jgi:hypothetical protein